MGFKRNYVKEINEILMTKRTDDDTRLTLNIPEHKFKKNSEKFNFALRSIYDKYRVEEDIKLFHLLLALQEYFDMDWLVENILDESNNALIRQEMIDEYSIDPNAKARVRPRKLERHEAGYTDCGCIECVPHMEDKPKCPCVICKAEGK
jgi:hypothetical protein